MKIALSIVEFNTQDLLKNCLESIFTKKWRNDFQVFVVDNASKDNSVEMVKEKFSKVTVIANEENLGFGKAHNLIFKKIKADYFIILNSDTEVKDDVLDQMVDFMEDNKNCGISSCRVLDFNGKLQPNGGDLPFGRALINWLFNLETIGVRYPSLHRNDEEYYREIHPVGWVSGNFMIIRRESLEKVGGFDERYFMYFEDIDLCYRVRKSGFTIMLNPSVSIKHLSGGSLDNPRLRQWSGEFKGLIKFYESQMGKFAGLAVRLGVYIAILLRIIAFAFKGNLSYSYNYAKVIASI